MFSVKSDSKSPTKTEGGHSLKASSRVKERGQAVNHCWERVELGSLSLWDSAGDTWGVCLWPWLKGEHSQGDDVSQAAFLSQVQERGRQLCSIRSKFNQFPGQREDPQKLSWVWKGEVDTETQQVLSDGRGEGCQPCLADKSSEAWRDKPRYLDSTRAIVQDFRI